MEQNKTTHQALKELDEAWDKFFYELCKSIKIPEILDWLVKKL